MEFDTQNNKMLQSLNHMMLGPKDITPRSKRVI